MPATSFCEWTDSRPKVTNWFALDESRPLFAFAGIWRLWTGERKGETREHRLFLVSDDGFERAGAPDPRQSHAAVAHDARRMGYLAARSVDEATALQRPLTNHRLRILGTGQKADE